MSSERIYDDGTVSITKTLAVLGSTSYPVNGITAVQVDRKPPNQLMLVLGVAIFMACLFLVSELLAVPVTLVYVWWVRKRQPLILVLRTAGGQVAALESRDGPYLQKVRSYIEQAVTARG
jgi:hypothetical protein